MKLVLWFGAEIAIPATPSTIAVIATCSLRPARSPSIRSPASISTSRPAASVGCTTTRGASLSATTCSGQPSIESAVPNSHRRPRSSLAASASRKCACDGASLASIAWKATPML